MRPRPPFALERLQERDVEHLIYDTSKPGPGGSGAQILTPLQLIDHLAALVPPPRVHRHRYFGVLAPNSPLRAAVTIMALPAAPPLKVRFRGFLLPLPADRSVRSGSGLVDRRM